MAEEGYRLTPEDCVNLERVQGQLTAMGIFATQIGAAESAQDLGGTVQWFDDFMVRVGATEVLDQLRKRRDTFTIPPAAQP